MLYEVLQIVFSGGLHSLKQLAQQLDVSQALAESMIHDLVRMGYLKLVCGTCTEACACSLAGTCGIAGSGRIWALTEAGQEIVQSRAS